MISVKQRIEDLELKIAKKTAARQECKKKLSAKYKEYLQTKKEYLQTKNEFLRIQKKIQRIANDYNKDCNQMVNEGKDIEKLQAELESLKKAKQPESKELSEKFNAHMHEILVDGTTETTMERVIAELEQKFEVTFNDCTLNVVNILCDHHAIFNNDCQNMARIVGKNVIPTKGTASEAGKTQSPTTTITTTAAAITPHDSTSQAPKVQVAGDDIVEDEPVVEAIMEDESVGATAQHQGESQVSIATASLPDTPALKALLSSPSVAKDDNDVIMEDESVEGGGTRVDNDDGDDNDKDGPIVNDCVCSQSLHSKADGEFYNKMKCVKCDEYYNPECFGIPDEEAKLMQLVCPFCRGCTCGGRPRRHGWTTASCLREKCKSPFSCHESCLESDGTPFHSCKVCNEQDKALSGLGAGLSPNPRKQARKPKPYQPSPEAKHLFAKANVSIDKNGSISERKSSERKRKKEKSESKSARSKSKSSTRSERKSKSSDRKRKKEKSESKSAERESRSERESKSSKRKRNKGKSESKSSSRSERKSKSSDRKRKKEKSESKSAERESRSERESKSSKRKRNKDKSESKSSSRSERKSKSSDRKRKKRKSGDASESDYSGKIQAVTAILHKRVQEATVLRDGDDLLQPGDEQYLEKRFAHRMKHVVIHNKDGEHGIRCGCGNHRPILLDGDITDKKKLDTFYKNHRRK